MSCNQEWTPKEGAPLPIHDMANSHLRNAWAALKRREAEGMMIGFPDFRGERAQEFAESQFFAEQEAHDEMIRVLIPALEAEFKRRGMVLRERRNVDKLFMGGGRV